jgi:Skp family chaperone for outer membrane proteins
MIATLTDLPSPTGADLLTWLSCLGVILGIVVLFKKAFGKEPSHPQPFVVQAGTRFATHEELERLRADFARFQESWNTDFAELEDKIDKTYRELNRDSERRAKEIHDRVNDVLKAVSRLEGPK